MKISIAQTRPVTGDVQQNIYLHQRFIVQAAAGGADLIVFPELSLTGYELTLAQELALNPEDDRLHVFQSLAATHNLTIGVGAPTCHPAGVCISLIIFRPDKSRHVYSKQHLHPDEEAFFVSGGSSRNLIGEGDNVALAICYELSVPEHAAQAFAHGAAVYIASVAKYAHGVDMAAQRLVEIAHSYAMTVVMANAVGPADGGECAGQTAVWNTQGRLVAQLDNAHEGLILYDTDRQKWVKMAAVG
ncbi:MAG: carbon-nitrogen hydrolase family protein [Chloroflexi bacterium]|nr:carbon-nitrogen hydrolase family protein [Chloroflexota bacterium]